MDLIQVGWSLFGMALRTDSVVCRIPVARRVRGIVLDTILGPAEPFEYESKTAPGCPPPTSSRASTSHT